MGTELRHTAQRLPLAWRSLVPACLHAEPEPQRYGNGSERLRPVGLRPMVLPSPDVTDSGPTSTTACTSSCVPRPVACTSVSCPSCGCPITPNPVRHAGILHGHARGERGCLPRLHVAPAAYRFKILSAGNDRSWNLSWFVADRTQNNTEVAMLPAAPPSAGSPLPLCASHQPRGCSVSGVSA